MDDKITGLMIGGPKEGQVIASRSPVIDVAIHEPRRVVELWTTEELAVRPNYEIKTYRAEKIVGEDGDRFCVFMFEGEEFDHLNLLFAQGMYQLDKWSWRKGVMEDLDESLPGQLKMRRDGSDTKPHRLLAGTALFLHRVVKHRQKHYRSAR